MHPIAVAFVLALASHLAVEVWLARRQIAHVLSHRTAIPAGFETSVTAAEHARAADYSAARQRAGILETVYDAALVLALTLGGGIDLISTWIGRVLPPGLLSGTLLVLAAFALLALLGLPFAVYRTFGIEQRFGFNRTTPRTFIVDRLKGWTLGLVLGGGVACGVLWIMATTGSAWWLVGWGAWMAFTLVVTWAWPRLIAPIFNRFVPLEDAALRERIDALLARCGFHAKAVYVMDGSKRSSHGNAYFTGLGREKRIVFFDTLLSSLDPAQVESVLAHELAHFKLRHVPQRLFAGAGISLAGFALLGWLSAQDWFYQGLGVREPGAAAALLLFVLAVPPFTWVFSPLMAAWSRHHEYQADEFAARHSDAVSLAEALVRLYKDNAATLTPDPLYSAFHDSHPPPAARIARLRELAALPAGAA